MRTLVIDCATEACSVALFEHGTLIAGDWRILGRGHAELLVPMIATLPNRGRATRIAFSQGPGSFTGLRVGLSAARALALAWQAELVSYPTLDLVAAMAFDQYDDVQLGVAMTAGHGDWFVQQFDRSNFCNSTASCYRPAMAIQAITADCVAGSKAQELVTLRGWGQTAALLPDARRFDLLPIESIQPASAIHYGRSPDARLPGDPDK